MVSTVTNTCYSAALVLLPSFPSLLDSVNMNKEKVVSQVNSAFSQQARKAYSSVMLDKVTLSHPINSPQSCTNSTQVLQEAMALRSAGTEMGEKKTARYRTNRKNGSKINLTISLASKFFPRKFSWWALKSSRSSRHSLLRTCNVRIRHWCIMLLWCGRVPKRTANLLNALSAHTARSSLNPAKLFWNFKRHNTSIRTRLTGHSMKEFLKCSIT